MISLRALHLRGQQPGLVGSPLHPQPQEYCLTQGRHLHRICALISALGKTYKACELSPVTHRRVGLKRSGACPHPGPRSLSWKAREAGSRRPRLCTSSFTLLICCRRQAHLCLEVYLELLEAELIPSSYLVITCRPCLGSLSQGKSCSTHCAAQLSVLAPVILS